MQSTACHEKPERERNRDRGDQHVLRLQLADNNHQDTVSGEEYRDGQSQQDGDLGELRAFSGLSRRASSARDLHFAYADRGLQSSHPMLEFVEPRLQESMGA